MRVLGLFAKEPRPGLVKTRLAAETSAAWAAQVADACLQDLLDRLTVVEARRILAFAPDDAHPYFAALAQSRYELTPQGEGDLGARLCRFVTNQLARGATAVIVVGSDSPTIPLEYVQQAFALLEQADVVLGPAHDGGYYLLGCRRLPPIFDGITWGTARVLGETVARLDDPAWRLALLPPWSDVDTMEDWWMLKGHLAALRRADIEPGVPRIEQLPLSPDG
jgi:hypothetical protein